MSIIQTLNKNSITEGISRGDYVLKRNTGKRVKHYIWTYVDLICNKDNGNCIGFVRCRKCYEIYSFKPQNGIKHLINHPCDNKRLNNVSRYVPVNEEAREVAKRAALEFCAVDLHPPEALKGKGLLNLIQMGINIGSSLGLVKADKLIPHPTTISRYLPQELVKISIEDLPKIKLALKEERISFAIGEWTDKNEHHFITLSAHYIRESWSLENRILYTSSFPQEIPYNGKNIREEIEHKLDLLGLSMEDFKNAHIITDEGANIKKALEGFKRSSCLAHCLSDVLRHTFDSNYWMLEAKLPEITQVLNGCKSLVTFLKQSGLIQSLPRMVHQDCEFQWSIKISMLESVLEQWNEIQDLLQKQGHLYKIKQIYKTLLQDLITFLKPFKQEIDKLREDKYPTVQFALIMKARLKKHMDTIHAKVENVEVMSRVEERASFYFQRKIVIGKEQRIATFLTPSFRGMRMISAEERDEVIRDLRKTYGPFQHDVPTSTEPIPKRFKTMYDAYEEWCDESQTYQTLDEIDIYLNVRNSDCQDLLTFWKSQEQRLPRLCDVARRILCIPTTAVTAERDNITGNILDTCHDLSPEMNDHFHTNSVLRSKRNTDSCSNGSEIGIKIEIEEEPSAEEGRATNTELQSKRPLISDADLHDSMVYFSSDITAKSIHGDTNEMDTTIGIREESCLEKVIAMIKSEPVADADLEDDIEDTSSCINGVDEDFPMVESPRLHMEVTYSLGTNASNVFTGATLEENIYSDDSYDCEQIGLGEFSEESETEHCIYSSDFKKVYKCELCGESYALSSQLKKHSLIHDKRPHKCEICKKSFLRLLHLKMHTLIHEGKRPYTCEICERSFTHMNSLKRHTMIHEGKKPHKCKICEKCFRCVSDLRIHNLIHEGKRLYKCKVCDKSFNLASYLKMHSLIHERKTPYECKVCGRQFTQPSSLRRHNLIHNKV